jgi:ABC-type transporter Mla maintaining outer membrane lipid asymmetry ATPase subunit MlaF
MYSYEKKETILKVENVSLNYGESQILKDINVEVKNIVRPGMTQGQIIGFLGPSGIGKCFTKNTKLKIRNKKTGKEEEMTVFELLKRFPRKYFEKRIFRERF